MTPDLTTAVVDVLLLTLLAVTAITIVRLRSLFAVVMLTGIYSFLGASWMFVLDAPDVAFTEAAVGAGIATILMLATLALTGREAKPRTASTWLPLAAVTLTGAALIFGTVDMPPIGDPDAAVQRYPSPSYVERTPDDIGIPNVVTAVLASYRGYDTFGETFVVFTAAVAVMLLLRGHPRRKDERP
jgi:multicomponent Na+:H+ antiporter subunit B